jgi:anti-anti-sigma regulatory factor
MEHERTGDLLTVRLQRDFNLLAARHLQHLAESAMNEGAERVRVDLSEARLVDTEAIIALDRLQRQGLHVTLVHPPALFQEVLELLDLTDAFETDVASQ